MDYLFPLNPSLSDELQRLFARMPSRFEQHIPDNTDDFQANGVDREFCPDFEWSPNWSPPISPAMGHMMPQPRVNYIPANMRRPYITAACNAATSRGKRRAHTECVFCRNNGEPSSWFRSHSLRDSAGRVTCPVLRAYTCPICGTSGDTAHTIKYCPRNRTTTDFALNSMGLVSENNPFMRRNRAK